MSISNQRLLLVVNSDPIHVGAHLLTAARSLGLDFAHCNSDEVFRGPWWLNKINWYFRERRPTRLTPFSQEVLARCRQFQPRWVLVTGLSPLDIPTLRAIGELGISRLNFLTDDPWNPAHRSRRNLAALAYYDWAFSPRRSNLEDLRRAGCAHVAYLPFAYDPGSHFIEPPAAVERSLFTCDLMFAGARDPDRVPYVQAAISAGLDVALYGIYWERHGETRAAARGQVGMPTLRKAIQGARINLCLVRRANRDGHAMRSFEIPAIGGCMLAELTPEHQEILGREGETVSYFRTPEEMVEKARWLLAHDEERARMAEALHRRIYSGHHAYRDRLQTMLELSLSDAERERRVALDSI